MTKRLKLFSPSILSIYGKHLLSLFSVAAVCFVLLLFLVEKQMAPYFYSEFYERVQTAIRGSESMVALALLEGNQEKATRIVEETPLFRDATSKKLSLVSLTEPREKLECAGQIQSFKWGKVCRENTQIFVVLPISSVESLVGDLRLHYRMNIEDWGPYKKMKVAILLSLLSLFVAGMIFFVLFYRTTVRPIRRTLSKVSHAETEADFVPLLKELPFEELQSVTAKLAVRSKDIALSKIARQVAHDIRSPLTLLLHLSEKPEVWKDHNEQDIFRRSISQIRFLSDDLLKRFRGENQEAAEQPWSFLFSVIRSVISAKQISTPLSLARFYVDIPEDLKLESVALSASVFDRILSNILSNAIEAVPSDRLGQIKVSVARVAFEGIDSICLQVIDNGKGMNSKVLEMVRQGSGTHGKTDGNGIGLQLVKSEVGKVGGIFEIDSIEDKGTTVKLTLPIAPRPQWLLTELNLKNDERVVVVDDCDTIGKLWKQRLPQHEIEFYHSMPADSVFADQQKTTFLIDYDLKMSKTGLDAIRDFQIAQNSVLVTAAYDDPKVQAQVLNLGCKMLPKLALPFVPILIS